MNTTNIIWIIAIGTVLSVLIVMYGISRPRNSKSLIELEMEIYRDWECTIGDGLEYEPVDVFGRPFPLEDALSNTGAGWAGLIRECYQLCVEHEVDIHQIKEKFGGLRFYTGAVSSEKGRAFFDRINAICDRSYTTCENCGELGELDKARGWWKTLCSSCTEVCRADYDHTISHLWRPSAEEFREQMLNSNDPDDITRLHEGELT